MENLHTPGPWKVVRTEQHPQNENEAVTFIQTPKLCYDLSFVKGILTQEEHEANARLIAAAPELLEACQLLSDELIKSKSMTESDKIRGAYNAINKASKAIQKATTNV